MAQNPHDIPLTSTRSGLIGVFTWMRDYFASQAGLTASRVMVTDADGRITQSTMTAAEATAVGALGNSLAVVTDSGGALVGSATTAAQIAYLTSLGGTASRAVVTDANGKLDEATTTAAEIGYVNGVTSAIQTQLDAKLASAAWGVPACWAGLGTSLTGVDLTTATEIVLDSENIDTAGAFDVTTGRFTPQVAGKYGVFARIDIASWTLTASTSNVFAIRKNGATTAGNIARGVISYGIRAADRGEGIAIGLFSLNGSTDYLSLFQTISTDISVNIVGESTLVGTMLIVFRLTN